MDVRPGQLIKISAGVETLDNCTHGVIIGEFDNHGHSDDLGRAWRVLCGDRIIILWEHEFEVIE